MLRIGTGMRIGAGGGKPIQYLLLARFSTDIAAPLPASLPIDVGGPLTVVDTNSVMSQSSGQFIINGTQAINDRIVTPLFARVVGRAFGIDLPVRTSLSQLRVGPHAANIDATVGDGAVYTSANTPTVRSNNTTVDASTLVGVSGHHAYLFVQRATGGFILERNGPSGVWKLAWVDTTQTYATYYKLGTNAAGANTMTADNLRVLDLARYDARFATDYGIALNRSTFTAADSTALTAITPEKGGAWTVRSGTWDIQSNKLECASTGNATVESTSADILAELTINFKVAGTGTFGMIVRYTDENNYWAVYLATVSNVFALREVNAGTPTTRASVTVTPAALTDYRIVVVAEGSTVSAYLNNANKITYSTATLNQTVARHGVRDFAGARGVTGDDFAIWPRVISLPAGV